MVIQETDGTETDVKQRTAITFEKVGTPGARRWYLIFTPKGKKCEKRIPVRGIRSVKNGRTK